MGGLFPVCRSLRRVGFISRMQETKSRAGFIPVCRRQQMWTSQREEHSAQFARFRTTAMQYAPHHEGMGKLRDALVACPLLREV